MKNFILFLFVFLITACTPMDDKYKDFVKDGPIVYLSKLNEQAVQVIGEKNRINFQWPALTDPRGKKVIIYWSSRSGKYETNFNPAQPTSIFVAPLEEGSYIFEIIITDDGENSSIPISTTGYVYGSLYESYLINRRIIGSSLTEDGRTITYTQVVDETMIGSEFEWTDGEKTSYTSFIPSSQLNATLDDCKALSFRYRTHYIPEGGIDVFYSPWEYYVENVKTSQITYNADLKQFIFPAPNDGNLLRYEMSWTDLVTGEPHSFTVEGNEAIIPDYNAKEFTYHTVFSIDEQQFVSSGNTFQTIIYVTGVTLDPTFASLNVGDALPLTANVQPANATDKNVTWSSSATSIATVEDGIVTAVAAGQAIITVTTTDGTKTATCNIEVNFVDLDRSKWYAAPETDLDNNPLENVNFGPNPGTASATTGNLITNKKKSPYLSHLLPWSNAALSATSGDGVNHPSAHFDNNSMSYLSMVKGIGTDATSGTVHTNGGVIITAAEEKPWFIIRLDETQPQRFNYFRMRFRENGSNGSGLKPQGVTFFGSNDDNCITDDSKWTKINPEIIVPPSSTANSTQPAAGNMGTFTPGANLESGNVFLPRKCEYKYIKMQYDRWDVASNTMQIAEFWLGLCE